jgi:hypothetical protein
LWGSKTTTDKGKKLEDFLSQEGLCIFNDGTDTYLHPGNGSYSAIGLTVTDPSLLLDFSSMTISVEVVIFPLFSKA